MLGHLGLSQSKVLESFKGSFGNQLDTLKSNVSGIDWVQRSVTAAQYAAYLANKDAWFAMSDAMNAMSQMSSAFSDALQAEQSAMQASKEAFNAMLQVWRAEVEALFAKHQADTAEYREILAEQEKALSQGKREMSDAALNSIQSNTESKVNNIAYTQACITVNNNNNEESQNNKLVLTSDLENQEASKSKDNIKLEDEKGTKKRHSQKESEAQTKQKSASVEKKSRIIEMTTKESEKTNISKLKDFATLRQHNSQLIQDNAQYIMTNATQKMNDANKRSSEASLARNSANFDAISSMGALNNFHKDVKKIDNLSNFLVNLASVIKESEAHKAQTTLTQKTGKSDNLSKIHKLQNNLDCLKTKIADPKKEMAEINIENETQNIMQEAESIKNVVKTTLQIKNIPVVIDKNLESYTGELSNSFGADSIRLDQRIQNRRGTTERRLDNKEDNYFSNQRSDTAGRRRGDRRQDDISKALFIRDEEVAMFLS